ncbi:unnamed protein product [Caenorhabditis sp. 36 PRJEB53466]|nr:unnamed protein product [Caenorhabditis sp. 36 PRJEB53466]
MSSDVRKDATPYGRTLKQYSVDEKLAIISHAKDHGNRAAGREFNVAESSIREWRKNELKLRNSKNNIGLSAGNNNNHSKIVNLPQQILVNENTNAILRAHMTQYASMIDIESLNRAAKLIDIQRTLSQMQPESAPSSVGTPSSSSSASTPPPPSVSPTPTPPASASGAGRRKPKCPQKIEQSSAKSENVVE